MGLGFALEIVIGSIYLTKLIILSLILCLEKLELNIKEKSSVNIYVSD